jgi:outer membrane lipoprotein-sorting protein
MKRTLPSLLLLWSAAARADAGGDAVVAWVDAGQSRAKSHYLEYEATTTEPGRGEKKLGINVWIQGDKRLSEFTAPADLKGTKVLILSGTEMYAYLPAFGKVRRIASHTTDQSAFGMVFSQDDLATLRYGGDYAATMKSEDDKAATVVLVPRPGKAGYPKLEMTVAKDLKLPTEIKYFDGSGGLLKTETRSGYTCETEVCVPSELKMVDKNGLATVLVRKKWKLNAPVSDDLFSKRSLDK